MTQNKQVVHTVLVINEVKCPQELLIKQILIKNENKQQIINVNIIQQQLTTSMLKGY